MFHESASHQPRATRSAVFSSFFHLPGLGVEKAIPAGRFSETTLADLSLLCLVCLAILGSYPSFSFAIPLENRSWFFFFVFGVVCGGVWFFLCVCLFFFFFSLFAL